MRTYLLLAGLAWCLAHPVSAQKAAAAPKALVPAPGLPADSLTHRIKFQGVVPVPGVSAAELQGRAREWVALTFMDAHAVTQLDDAVRGVLIVRGYTASWVNMARKFPESKLFSFTCRLEFREGRYRYEVFDFGVPVMPRPSFATSTDAISAQLEQLASWQFSSSATVAATPRQLLYQPDLDSHPRENDVAAAIGPDWYEMREVLQQTFTRLVAALRQHETAPPAKW